jgi:class 3 adenylate cyclase
MGPSARPTTSSSIPSLVDGDMLKRGVDRLASRHAGMRSLFPRHPQRSMEAHHAQATRDRRSPCFGNNAVSETRKLAAILVSDVVGYSRLTGADEDRTLARLRTLRSDLIRLSPCITVASSHFGQRGFA